MHRTRVTTEMIDYIREERRKGVSSRDITKGVNDVFGEPINRSTVLAYITPQSLKRRRDKQKVYSHRDDIKRKKKLRNMLFFKEEGREGEKEWLNGREKLQILVMDLMGSERETASSRELVEYIFGVLNFSVIHQNVERVLSDLEKELGSDSPILYNEEKEVYMFNSDSSYSNFCGRLIQNGRSYNRHQRESRLLTESEKKERKEQISNRLYARSKLFNVVMGLLNEDRQVITEEELLSDIQEVTGLKFEPETVRKLICKSKKDIGENSPVYFDKKNEVYMLNLESPYSFLCGELLQETSLFDE